MPHIIDVKKNKPAKEKKSSIRAVNNPNFYSEPVKNNQNHTERYTIVMFHMVFQHNNIFKYFTE